MLIIIMMYNDTWQSCGVKQGAYSQYFIFFVTYELAQ